MKFILITSFLYITILIQAAPTKRDDEADRVSESQVLGAFNGLAIPDFFGFLPKHPLGGQSPDSD